MRTWLLLAASAAVFTPAAAMAQQRTQTGEYNGMTWTAQSRIVGQNSTATVAGGGNSDYLGHDNPFYSGVVQLRMNFGTAGAATCTGALLSTGQILTAAHCVSDGVKNDVNGRAVGLISTTAYFYSGTGQGTDPLMQSGGTPGAGVVAVPISQYYTHTQYTGEVIDQNDISILTLASAAPLFATKYDIHTGPIAGEVFNVAGYGLRSNVGGSVGYGNNQALGTGRLREGDNRYDLRLGEFFSRVGPTTTAAFRDSYLSDFDNGTAANNAGCVIFGRCDAGLGAREVSIASGDSGGPGFINGRISSVNSYGLSFGTGLGDTYCDPPVPPATQPNCLNSSFGEFNGFVPTFIHAAFIAGAVPEPSTWALMILGFGFVGGAMRRRTQIEARYAF